MDKQSIQSMMFCSKKKWIFFLGRDSFQSIKGDMALLRGIAVNWLCDIGVVFLLDYLSEGLMLGRFLEGTTCDKGLKKFVVVVRFFSGENVC